MNTTVMYGLYDTEEDIGRNGNRHEFILQTGTSHIFLGFDIFQVLLLFYFHYLMVLMTKRESKVRKGQELIKELLQCYSVMVPITFIGASVYLNVMTRYLVTPTIFKGFWFCVSFEVYIHISTIYIGGFSLYVASLKYWRIVHNPTATSFGVHKAKKICFVLHLTFPILISLLNSISNGKVDQIFSVDHCWSNESRNNMTGPSAYDKMKSFICIDRNYELEVYFGQNIGNKIEVMLRILCGSVKIFHFFLLSNLAELILYILILRYLDK